MAGKRCSLCGGRLRENRCEFCGLDNSIYERERRMENSHDRKTEHTYQTAEPKKEKKAEGRAGEKQSIQNKRRQYRQGTQQKGKKGCLTWIIILVILLFSVLPVLFEAGEKLLDEFRTPRYYIGEEATLWKG